LLVVVLMTLPASLRLSQKLVGNNIDNWIFYWNNWWLERAIHEGHNWFFTPYLFFPQGASLVAHSNSFLNSLLAFALKPGVGPVAAYNLSLLSGLWISAVGMFALVYQATRRISAGLVAGFIFAFAPYHLTQALAHSHLGSIHWWPFYVLFLCRALRDGRATDAVCAGLFAALTLWSGFQLAVLLALWTLLYIAWQFKTDHKYTFSRFATCGGLVGAVALALSAPMIIPVFKNWSALTWPATAFDESWTNQTDLLAYLLPPAYHPFIGARMVPFYERFLANRAFMPYLGYGTLVLTFLAFLGQRREVWFWLFSGCTWIVLASGAAPRFNGTVYHHIPLPYRLIGPIFPISVIRLPDRFNLLVVFTLAMIAGLGAAQLAQRRRWLLIPVGLLVIVEYLPIPVPMWDLPPSSSFLTQMAQEQTRYGVIDYPMGYTVSKLWLYDQTQHGKPMIEGHISRYTADNYAFIVSQPLLRALYQTAEQPVRLAAGQFADEVVTIPAPGPALRSLEAAGVRYILLHKQHLASALDEHFQRVLPIVPVYEDAILAVYDVARPLPFYFDGFPILLTPDVALVRFDVQTDKEYRVWRFQIVTQLLAPFTSSRACQVKLISQESDVQTLPISFFEGQEIWQPRDIEVHEIVTSLPPKLAPGIYHWTVVCPGAATFLAPETLRVEADGRQVFMRRVMNVRYGESIKFVGYRWRTTGADLQLALWWEVLQSPEADYKVFVHLLNTAGEVVRQYDAVPCNWQCPTSQWQAGATVADRATLALWGLSPGEYRLAIGLYRLDTQERLLAQGPHDELYPDAYLILPDVFLISEDQASSSSP